MKLNPTQREILMNYLLVIQSSIAHNQLIAIEKETKKTYIFKVQDGELLVSPTDTEQETWEFPEDTEKYVFLDSQIFKANNQLTIRGYTANNQLTISEHPANNQQTISEQENEIYFNSGKIEAIYSQDIEDEDLRIISEKFEDAIRQKIKTVKTANAVRTAHNDYLKYIEILEGRAKHKNTKIKELLIKVQDNIKESKDKSADSEKKAIRKAFYKQVRQWTISIALFLAISLGTGVFFTDYEFLTWFKASPTPTPTLSVAQHEAEKRTFTEAEIRKMIKDYNPEVGNWRTGKIIESFKNKQFTNHEALNLVIKGINKKY